MYGVEVKQASTNDPWVRVAKYDTRAGAETRVTLMMRHGGQAAVRVEEFREFVPARVAAKPRVPLVAKAKASPFKTELPLNLKAKKYFAAHLKLTEFSGVLQGSSYLLGGAVLNDGPGKSAQGRKLELYVVNYRGGDAVGRTLLRTVAVPALRANQSWTTPTIVVPTNQVRGSATANFQLFLTPGDGDEHYDWRIIWVSPVR